MNKVMLIGNVGQDPEVRYVDQGVAVARIRLATTEGGTHCKRVLRCQIIPIGTM